MSKVRQFIIAVCLTLSACAQNPAPVVKPAPPILPLRIVTYPQIAFPGTTMRIHCILPEDVGDGEFFMGVVDTFKSQGPIDRLQNSREIIVPCGSMRIYCGYREHGKEKPEFVYKDMESVGECR